MKKINDLPQKDILAAAAAKLSQMDEETPQGEKEMIVSSLEFESFMLPKDISPLDEMDRDKAMEISKIIGFVLSCKLDIQTKKLHMAQLLSSLKVNKNYKTKYGIKDFKSVCKMFGISKSTGQNLVNTIQNLKVDCFSALLEVGISLKTLYKFREGDIEITAPNTIRIGDTEIPMEDRDSINLAIQNLIREREDTASKNFELSQNIEILTNKNSQLQSQLIETKLDLAETKKKLKYELTTIQDEITAMAQKIRHLSKTTQRDDKAAILATYQYCESMLLSIRKELFDDVDADSDNYDFSIPTPEEALSSGNDEDDD